jgi:hypothetical protein
MDLRRLSAAGEVPRRSDGTSREAERRMDALRRAIWFFGDLDDPWVVSIADALPADWNVRRVACSGELAERPFEKGQRPRLAILHRVRMTAQDCERLRGWRERGSGEAVPTIMLCASPYLRYEDLERAAALVDRVLSEATAPDVIAGHAERLIEGRSLRPGFSPAQEPDFRVEVAGGTADLVAALVDACRCAGYRAHAIGDLADGARPQSAGAAPGQRVLTIWEVPVLEPGWSEQLEERARAAGPVIALLGIADRALVIEARAHGAVACLDVFWDNEELLDVIERASALHPREAWPPVMRAEPPHLLPPRSRRRRKARGLTSAPAVWPDQDERPTIG